MEEREILDIIKNRLEIKRYRHTIAVADTAEIIAEKIVSENKFSNSSDEVTFIRRVHQAALLHDYAKDLEIDELKKLAQLVPDRWKIDKEEMFIPQVLHAPVSAYLVEKDLGIVDQEVLEAIRYHTIGSPGMGTIARIIFLADFIEPNRKFTAAARARDEYNWNGLESAIIKVCEFNINYNISCGKLIHPNTILLRNAYLRRQT